MERGAIGYYGIAEYHGDPVRAFILHPLPPDPPYNAGFVPPPHTAISDCTAALVNFLDANDDGIPMPVRAGVAHLQFETIHPFLDGNGRVGRLIITLLFCQAGLLREPLLYQGYSIIPAPLRPFRLQAGIQHRQVNGLPP